MATFKQVVTRCDYPDTEQKDMLCTENSLTGAIYEVFDPSGYKIGNYGEKHLPQAMKDADANPANVLPQYARK